MRPSLITRRQGLQLLGASGLLGLRASRATGRPGCPHRAPPTVSIVSGERIGKPHPDLDSNCPTALDADGTFWLIQTIGGTIASTPWQIWKGTTIDDIVLQNRFVPDKHFPRPHGDDTYWAEGLWIDPLTKRWHVLMHTEYNYNKYQRHPRTGYSIDRFVTITLATSDDAGRSWDFGGEVIGSDHSDDPAHWRSIDADYYDGGQGDPALYVDKKYFYAFYNHRWLDRADVHAYFGAVRVARAPITGRMAPGTWKKFYLGQWNQPGLGGHDSDVINADYSDSGVVFYSKKYTRYFAVVLGGLYEGPTGKTTYGGYLVSCSDLAKQDWSQPIRVFDATNRGWYNWVIDPETQSRQIIEGDTFRLYRTEGKATRSMLTRFIPASDDPAYETAAPRFPPISVGDFTPGWDKRFGNCG